MSFTRAYGKYFDGHTSKPYDVELEIWPEKKISFFYNILIIIVWKINILSFYHLLKISFNFSCAFMFELVGSGFPW